jgi:hypothetical protein
LTGIVVFVLRIALALSLYAFLFWAVYSIYRELKTTSRTISSRRVPVLQLRLAGETVEIEKQFSSPEIIVGRDLACDFSISGATVSARHSRLAYHHNQWWVEDLHSTNGTFLNDDPVDQPTVIISGDDLRCGQMHLEITINLF